MMRNRMTLWGVIGVLSMLLMGSPGVTGELKKEVSITIFPCTDAFSSFNKFNPLISYLKAYTLLNVRLEFFEDFDSYERAVKNDELHFVLQDPLIYLQFADHYNKGSLLRTLTWEGKHFQSGVVIVRKDQNINILRELKGRRVMFGPKVSSARWVAARLLFEESNINVDTGLKGYANGGCCEDIAFNVYMKAVDAGVVCDHFLSEHSKKQKELGFDASQLIVIGKTLPVPTKVFTATRNVEPEIVASINRALLALDMENIAHRKILYAAELGGFLKTDNQAFNEMKTILGRITFD